MEAVLQTLTNGLIIGGIYALTAVGLTLIFGYMDLPNFAHGELCMLGAYFTFTFVVLAGLPFWVGYPLALTSVFIVAWVADALLLRPLQDEPLARVLTTVGLMILFQNGAQLIWSAVPKRLPPPIEGLSISVLGLRVAPMQLLVAMVALVTIVGAHVFMQYTRTGLAMRATFQDRDMAAATGVKVHRVYGLTFSFGAALAAAGGGLLAMVFLMNPSMGAMVTMKAFAVVLLGGLGSFPGAVIGGLVIGVVESFGATFTWAAYKDALAFLILILILILKPTGFFGKVSGVE